MRVVRGKSGNKLGVESHEQLTVWDDSDDSPSPGIIFALQSIFPISPDNVILVKIGRRAVDWETPSIIMKPVVFQG